MSVESQAPHSCAKHQRQTHGACTRCGTFVCDACDPERTGKCEDCRAREGDQRPRLEGVPLVTWIRLVLGVVLHGALATLLTILVLDHAKPLLEEPWIALEQGVLSGGSLGALISFLLRRPIARTSLVVLSVSGVVLDALLIARLVPMHAPDSGVPFMSFVLAFSVVSACVWIPITLSSAKLRAWLS